MNKTYIDFEIHLNNVLVII